MASYAFLTTDTGHPSQSSRLAARVHDTQQPSPFTQSLHSTHHGRNPYPLAQIISSYYYQDLLVCTPPHALTCILLKNHTALLHRHINATGLARKYTALHFLKRMIR